MPATKFTVTTFYGASRDVTVPDGILLYDSEGNRTVDHSTLGIGDKIRAYAGQPAEEITAKVAV